MGDNMKEQYDFSEAQADAPEAVIRTGRSFSIIWVVPLVAVIIGSWLIYKTLSEKGPEITIVFETADGLEANKTKIKYKDVEVGLVDSLSLGEDLSNVIVKAKLVKGFEAYLNDKTRFWVVRPRISAGEISGLGTLVAGAYIAVDPSREGNSVFSFKGLEKPPAITGDIVGSRFLLYTDKLGSLDVGAPIYYRQLRVGEVEDYALDEDGKALTIKVFINAPYDKFIFNNTRFWNASGIDFSVDANGLKVNTESIVTVLLGGIAFETPIAFGSTVPAKAGDRFQLYKSYQDTLTKKYRIKGHWLVRFNGSIRGLSLGSPVEFRGIQVGQVLDIDLKIDPDNPDFRIPVLIEIEPERIFKAEKIFDAVDKRKEYMASLVEKGLRAQLKSGNLLTGQLVVDLDFHSGTPPQEIVWDDPYPELPVIQTPMEEIFKTISDSLKKIDKLPLVEIGNDVRAAVKNLNQILIQVQSTMESINTEITPQTVAAMEQATKTLAEIERLVSSDSPLNQETRNTMEEFSDAARSIRVLVDYLERNPDSLIYGKGKDQ